jgi:hypothetical protein
MDMGATSGAAAEQDIKALENTGLPSTKVFMLPDKSKIRATQKMLLKHKLQKGAREMNVVPGLHSTLVSIPKMANADYIAVFDKHKATIYDATTTTITALVNPIVVAPWCQTTELLKLDLGAAVQETQDDTILLATAEATNAILTYPTINKPCCTTMLRRVFPQKKRSATQYKQEIAPRGQA